MNRLVAAILFLLLGLTVSCAPGEITLARLVQPTPSMPPPITLATATIQPTATPVPTRTLTPTLTPTPSPTRSPAASPTPSSTYAQPLPALYVDGPFVRRTDTHAAVWLKGVNIEEFRQPHPHSLEDLVVVQGLGVLVRQHWGINLLRVAIDPETVQEMMPELDKLIDFAEANRMYVLLVPFASAINPVRSEQRMALPDALVTTAMGYLADKFKNRTNVLYGLWNEPHPDTLPSTTYDQQWRLWMEAGVQVAQAIRNKNPQAVLVVPGGTKWARDLTFYRQHPFPFNNVIYDVHDYAAAPDYGYSRDVWTWAIGKYPLLIGEFGGSPINPYDPTSLSYMRETLRIIDQHPESIHSAMYVLSDDGAWGLFTRDLAKTPKGTLLQDDLKLYPPSAFP